jgi:WD40 repeat protein
MAIKVFINYRRDDTGTHVHRIYDWLAPVFGKENVFLDVDSLRPGEDWDDKLKKTLAETDVLLAVIGTRWADILQQRNARGGSDHVREEIAAALAMGTKVIPVLIDGAPLPREDDLQPDMRKLLGHQQHRIACDSLASGAAALITAIRKLCPEAVPQPAEAKREAPEQPAAQVPLEPFFSRKEETVFRWLLFYLFAAFLEFGGFVSYDVIRSKLTGTVNPRSLFAPWLAEFSEKACVRLEPPIQIEHVNINYQYDDRASRLVRTFTGPLHRIKAATFSASGRYAIGGSSDATIKVWVIGSGRLLNTLTGHEDGIRALAAAISLDDCVLSASEDGKIKLWHLMKGKEILSFDGDRDCGPNSLPAPDGQFGLLGGIQNALKLCRKNETEPGPGARGGKISELEVSPPLMLKIAAITPDGVYGLVGSFYSLDDPGVNVEAVECLMAHEKSPELDCRLKGYDDHHHDEISLSVVAFPARLHLRILGNTDMDPGHVTVKMSSSDTVAISPDGHLGLSGGYSGPLKLWDLGSGKMLQSFKGHAFPIEAAVFSPGAKYVLSAACAEKPAGEHEACKQGSIKLWDAATGQELHEFLGHTSAVTALAFSPDGRFILSGGADGTLKLWDVSEWTQPQKTEPWSAAAAKPVH